MDRSWLPKRFRPVRRCPVCGLDVRMPRSERSGGTCTGPNPESFPGTPHQGPWATPAEIKRWDEWRADRALLDARVPREYLLDGQMIRGGADFGYAVGAALHGPAADWAWYHGLPTRYFSPDGFTDWLKSAWPQDAVLVWQHHDPRDLLGTSYWWKKPVFDVLVALLDECAVAYRLE